MRAKKIQLGAPRPTSTENRFVIDIPTTLGRGRYTIDLFNSGLKLVILQTAFRQPVWTEGLIPEDIIGFGFCLAGRFEAFQEGLNSPMNLKAGDTGFFTFPGQTEIREHLPTDEMARIYLLLEGEILASFARGDEDCFSSVFRSLDSKRAHRLVQPITPLMRALLYQILYCPYCGKSRSFYLEGKSMELLSHKLAQINPSCACCNSRLKSADYDRIRYAAEILVNNLENPPDTKQLARSVGMSRSTLHRFFRQVYGMAPFEYLRNHRLQTAMQLLQSGEINVTEAAFRVGYSNLSYFSKAFKAMFGVAPGELLGNPAPAYSPSVCDCSVNG